MAAITLDRVLTEAQSLPADEQVMLDPDGIDGARAVEQENSGNQCQK